MYQAINMTRIALQIRFFLLLRHTPKKNVYNTLVWLCNSRVEMNLKTSWIDNFCPVNLVEYIENRLSPMPIAQREFHSKSEDTLLISAGVISQSLSDWCLLSKEIKQTINHLLHRFIAASRAFHNFIRKLWRNILATGILNSVRR